MNKLLFYVRKEDLQTALDYNRDRRAGGKEFKGMLFELGIDDFRQVCLFYNPVFSDREPGNPDIDVTEVNDQTEPGCPYPPGYETFQLHHTTQDAERGTV